MTQGRATLLRHLEQQLEEDREDARARERALIAELEAEPAMPIVLFGAGNLGRRTASILRTRGRPVAAFMDNDPRLWGSSVDGTPVLSPSDGSSRFGRDGLAVVTIWRAEGGHDFLMTRDELRLRGWRRVESFIPLYWGLGADALPYITIDLPSRVLEAGKQVLAAAQQWADDRSLRDYVGQIRWRLTADFAALPAPEPDQYFVGDLVRLTDDEVFADCGAFTGDTMLDVARRVRSWRGYHAFEPDPTSFSKLRTAMASLPTELAAHVELHRAAVADRTGVLRFSASGLASSALDPGGQIEVECVSIDDAVTGPPPTFIKMDIEGAEETALRGARAVIGDNQPLLAIAAYHRQADIWQLPEQVHEMVPEHRLFLRPHAGEGFDTVLYAVPSDKDR
jgi:FkbM family methyltransferase